ncbi:IS110 family transposase, partial [Thiolapillus sp.]|uniref:IS110 family transposase n=1 Tax=Thiolapillus sp. TaxID=2017437 RepID=UPI003AF9FDE6
MRASRPNSRAKNVFHAVCCDQYGKQVGRKLLRRNQVLAYFAQMESCLVGMESCGSAHYWARELQKPGHQVKLIPPQYVKPYLRGNKNDYNDALAIAEAVTRPEMRFSAINTQEQQDIQALHRLRERRIQERTALCNQVRGLLAEYGLIIKVGVRSLQRKLPDLLEDAENGLRDVFRRYLIQIQQQLQELDAHIDFYNDLLQEQNRQNEACQR